MEGKCIMKNSREIALKILYEVDVKKAYSSISINRNLRLNVNELDELFIRELVYGVLENLIFIDWIIKRYSKVRFSKISPIVKEILRLGIYQIIFMDRVPDSAACNESVKLAKKYSHKGTVGFVNGILRTISRNKNNIEIPDKKLMPIKYLSIKYSYPEWMIERWINEFGFEFTEKLCIANNKKPKLNIRVNTLKISRDNLIRKFSDMGLKVYETRYADDGIVVENPIKITDTDEFKKGYFQIQDESSMLVGQILNPKEGSLILDVCSAPGGKTTHIAQKMNNKGKIIARDIHEHKLKLIEQNAQRLGIDIIETEVFDALVLDDDLVEKIDYCVVDVPCSGFGLIRRKPEIKYNKSLEDIKEISQIQYNILRNSSRYLKQNGILVYSTCTIEREENIKLINRFLSENPMYKFVPIEEVNCDDMKINGRDGYIELFPNIHGTDGFFIAKLIKIY
ncbi:16S rRNA (cytosine(967)-C(5))-methyltransferase RsmB [Caloranaerobacter azorensis]|uniref:Transcription antitermination protein NusB n=2 Tax=Caloranaerobacter azorensis TaxID=116090 RepID=A0A6P1YIP8_9FIRM|nr:16S rRNA (cytosine(967)-C(5))-methyltransferase RsmB [Caloranaerobacter azorensis]